MLGDGPSRHDEAHGRLLREQAHSLSSVKLEDLLGDEYGDDDAHTWALDVTPDASSSATAVEPEARQRAKASVGAQLGVPAAQLATVGGAAGRVVSLTALLLPD